MGLVDGPDLGTDVTHNDQTVLDELIQTWRTATESGRDVSLTALCQSYPHLLPELQKWIESQSDSPDSVTFSVCDTAPTRLAVPSARQTFQAGDHFGGFVLVRRLGRGGMGEVWEADEPAVPRKVAIKIMRPELASDPSLRRRFLREVRAQATVNHPNVVPLFAIGERDGVPYFAMALLVGETLAARLKRVGHLPPAEVIRIGRAVAEGLQAVHLAGLVHRDVKPGNVGLNAPYDHVMVLDFGIVRGSDLETTEDPLTNSGVMLGTPGYMSPEQVLGRTVDARADLFSLGAMLYEMATGSRPFQAESAYSSCTALVHEHPPRADSVRTGIPTQLAELIDHLMAKSPQDRWPGSAGEVAMILGRLESPDAATVTIPRRKRSISRNRRWRFVWLALFVLLLVVTAGGFVWFGSGNPARPTVVLPTAEDRLREFATRLREQPLDYRTQGVTKNGVVVNVKQNKLRFTGTTGVPIRSDVVDGKATITLPYDGTYVREHVEFIFIGNETKPLGGVLTIFVTVNEAELRVTEFKVTDTHGEVTNTGHDGQRCAKEAVMGLVNRVLDGR